MEDNLKIDTAGHNYPHGFIDALLEAWYNKPKSEFEYLDDDDYPEYKASVGACIRRGRPQNYTSVRITTRWGDIFCGYIHVHNFVEKS